MKNLQSLSFSLILLYSTLMSHAFAGASGTVGTITINTDPNCVTNINDIYEPRVRMTKGPDAGACINATLRRSVMELTPIDALKYFPAVEGTIVVANFSHKNKFWLAQIPISKVTNMVLQSEHFPMVKKPVKILIDHTQIRYDFSEPIHLISQDSIVNEEKDREEVYLDHLILSAENIGPRGEAFNFFGGAKGHFNVAYRLVSLEDKYNWMIAKQSHTVSQRKFSISLEDQKAVLREGIRRGTTYGSSRPYDSYTLNCSTEILDYFHVLFGKRKSKFGYVSNRLPEMLEHVKVLSDEKVPTLNEEYDSIKD